MTNENDILAQVLGEDEEAPPQTPAGTPEIQFEIKRFVFLALLDKASSVVPVKDIMPVLKHFQFDVQPGRLRVTATDLELSVISTTELVTVTTPGTAVFPARKMTDIITSADEGIITVHVTRGVAHIASERTHWNLKLAGGADYPPMPEISDVQFAAVDRTAFLTALHSVRYAACKETTRPSLMMVNIKDGYMTACDGARFQQARIGDFPFHIQIPIGAVDDLTKLLRRTDLPDIHVGEADHHLIFRFGADVFIINKLLAQFPDMETLLLRPALENRHTLTVGRADILDALRRVRINADPETSAIGLQLTDGHVTVSARDKFGNTATETIEAVWAHASRTLVVNHAFLTDMINMHGGDTCTFRLGDDLKSRKTPVMLRDDTTGTTGVVQQMSSAWVGQA